MLKKIFFSLGSLLLLISLLSCVTQGKPADKPVEKLSEVAKAKSTAKTSEWIVALGVSGGFAGWIKNISVDSSGKTIVNDLRQNKSSQKIISNKELSELSKLLEQLKSSTLEPESTKPSSLCSDCFQYELSIRWQNGQILASLNDINLTESKANKIVLFLRDILTKFK